MKKLLNLYLYFLYVFTIFWVFPVGILAYAFVTAFFIVNMANGASLAIYLIAILFHFLPITIIFDCVLFALLKSINVIKNHLNSNVGDTHKLVFCVSLVLILFILISSYAIKILIPFFIN